MKNFKSFFLFLSVAVFALCWTSCGGSDNEEELCPFNEITDNTDNSGAISFYQQYTNTQNAVLIDFRSVDEYNKGHIEGAVNMPATYVNTKESDSQWCVDLNNRYLNPKKTLYFYGSTDMSMIKVVAGRAACSFGKGSVFILSTGYNGLSKAYPELVEK